MAQANGLEELDAFLNKALRSKNSREKVDLRNTCDDFMADVADGTLAFASTDLETVAPVL